MNKTQHFLIGLASLATLSAPAATLAFPIAAPGTEGLIVVVGGNDDVVATYQGNSASYSNDLYLSVTTIGQDDDLFIFNNQTNNPGDIVNLGSFPVGTELVFRLFVNDTGYSFFTGPASRNPDNNTHARVQDEWQPGETLVSFEDLFNGPFDFNDLSFSFTNTNSAPPPVPEPTSILGLGTIAGLGLIRGLKRQLSKK